MTDPNGPAAWNPAGRPPQQGQGSDPELTQIPGQGAPGQQYPGYPQQGAYPETQLGRPDQGAPYPGAYPGQQPYPGQYPGQYPEQGYPTQGWPQQGGYPQQGTYPGYPTAGAETQAGYGPPGYPPGGYPGAPQGAAPKRGGGKVWIIVAAVVAALAVAAAVVVVVLVNRAPDPDTPVAQATSAPGTEIPDGSPSGLTDSITLDGGDSTVGRLEVGVRFEHPYPTEVTGVLTSPGGRSAVVVGRGSETSLQLTSTDPASPLQNLLGEPVTGRWDLTLTDGVPEDAGRLVSWDITAYPAAGDAPEPVAAAQNGTSSPGVVVPDDSDVGVSDTILLSGYGDVDRVRVDVQITHEVPSDLVVQLRTPTGEVVALADHDSSGTFTYESTAAGSPLAAVVGTPLAGPWELIVTDDIILDEGTFAGWSITVNG